MNNYRGISLINTNVKLRSAIGTNRIRNAVENHNILVQEQAGFCTGEECAAQVIALVECVLRRWINEMRPTYGCIRGGCSGFYHGFIVALGHRGVRQSDPSSPPLFYLFINRQAH
ncbi:hypothetical protein GAYE_SCF62G6554 [Galdieria yellowstonensis]|uniref:Uncharacterized protein n=1 Tax=Galdieria yellowstonensis TaxID=3028027 RepID=A0AAV9IMX6_9RHOD|nr:hypothetical protein GAYE_SCF62G6554 [Galdieria yellowstonensis]